MDNTYDTITEAHLWRYFAGQASGEEIDLLAAWVKTNESHKTDFQRVKELYYSTKHAPLRNQFDSKKALSQFKTTTQPTARMVWFRPWMAVAAMLTILIGCSLFFLHSGKQSSATIIAYHFTTQSTTYTLPDYSKVQLNKHSDLQYKTTTVDKRAATLSGEAFFDVKHTAACPFEVFAGKLKIRDIGTAYNVNAKNKDSIVVSVVSGKVQLISLADTSVTAMLSAGQTAYFTHNVITILQETPRNVLAWKKHVLSFNATPLPEVIDNLNSYFDTTLVLDSKAINQQLTVQLREPQLDSVLQLLQVMYNLKTTKDNRTILLRDKQAD